MDLLSLLTLIAFGGFAINSQQRRRRVALLGQHLGQYQIEKLMQTLIEGYLRALHEKDAERQAQVWNLLTVSEEALAGQFARFAVDFAKVDAVAARVSRLPLALPYAEQLFPATTFDARRLMELHAQGLARAAQNSGGQSPKDKAYTVMAELLLMQHSCHWFCKSKTVASARLLARHQTRYEQALAAVSPQTREAYRSLTGV